jgi:hypothetical protein
MNGGTRNVKEEEEEDANVKQQRQPSSDRDRDRMLKLEDTTDVLCRRLTLR